MLEGPEDLINASKVVIKVKEPTMAECSFYNLIRYYSVIYIWQHFQNRLACSANLGLPLLVSRTVSTADGQLPLLKPMSQIAGRLAVQNAVHYLQKHEGGRGVLMSGVGGVERENSNYWRRNGWRKCRFGSVGLGAEVTIFDRSGKTRLFG